MSLAARCKCRSEIPRRGAPPSLASARIAPLRFASRRSAFSCILLRSFATLLLLTKGAARFGWDSHTVSHLFKLLNTAYRGKIFNALPIKSSKQPILARFFAPRLF